MTAWLLLRGSGPGCFRCCTCMVLDIYRHSAKCCTGDAMLHLRHGDLRNGRNHAISAFLSILEDLICLVVFLPLHLDTCGSFCGLVVVLSENVVTDTRPGQDVEIVHRGISKISPTISAFCSRDYSAQVSQDFTEVSRTSQCLFRPVACAYIRRRERDAARGQPSST